ncbi:MAG TPA: hypothetical protein VGH10_01845 [Actinomycetota bacterium]
MPEPDRTKPQEGSAGKNRVPPRPVQEIVRDLEQERAGLVDAVDRLKAEAATTRRRVLSPGAIAGVVGAVAGLVALRRRRRRRRT